MSAQEKRPAEEMYADIIDLPHRISPYRSPMPRGDRAAQFAPFAALTGFEDVVAETARLTETSTELAEDEAVRLDECLRRLADCPSPPLVRLTCFRPDGRKAGGAYVTVTGRLREIHPTMGWLVLEDRRTLLLKDLKSIEWDDGSGTLSPLTD